MGGTKVYETSFVFSDSLWYTAMWLCNYFCFSSMEYKPNVLDQQQISNLFLQCYINNSDKHFPVFTLTECEDTQNWLIIFWLVSSHTLSRQCACHRILKSKHSEVVSGLVRSVAIPWSFHSYTEVAFRKKLQIHFTWNNNFFLWCK